MLALGTKVVHDGHGAGVIVAYNGTPAHSYAAQNLGSDIVAAAAGAGLVDAIVNSMYGSDRYPYVVQFDSGYKDVYDVDGAVMKVA